MEKTRKLREGYTTGSCAAAAAKAAAEMLLGGGEVEKVGITTPSGKRLELDVVEQTVSGGYAVCAVKKDAGDDPDVTNGIPIYARVKKTAEGIRIDGGEGVGRVTKAGLDQPVGAAAINSVPRKMIAEAVKDAAEELDYTGGFDIEIFAPDGAEIAKKTFNPRLGIEGGISILGTSGIVEPMSERAVLDTIRLELKMKRKSGAEYAAVTPGNYGERFLEGLGVCGAVKCGNFIGDTLDFADDLGFSGVLLAGHIGKLVKLGMGVMNTHSKYGDGRIECLISCALEAGCDLGTLKQIAECVTTDDALSALGDTKYIVSEILMKRIDAALKRRAETETGVIMFSDKYGVLAKNGAADKMIKKLRGQ